MEKGERVKALARLIKKYQDSYYSGEAEISDAEFDLLWDELKRIEPKHPLLSVVGNSASGGSIKSNTDGFPKARHLIPMGSQEKAANQEEFIAWTKKINLASCIAQFKLDGASLELQYENGKLKAALTRGDGIIGDDITPNAIRMAGVKEKIAGSFSGGVRGEVIMRAGVWKKKYPDKANCRNAANGVMRRKDGTGCEDLDFICYDAAANGNDDFFKTELEKMDWLSKQGFEVTETKIFSNPEEIIPYRELISAKRKSMDIDIDGIVVKDLITDMADLRRTRPERQIAFKFELESAYSILREVEWSESGTTYTPIGIVDPVRLAGTTVQRANLNNPDMIRIMGLKIGSSVIVVKRGEIIPKIEGLAPCGVIEEAPIKEEILLPTICASCNSTLVDAGTRLYCPNPTCPKKLHHRLEKWISVLDIRDLGEKLIKALFDSGRVCAVSDLYSITEKELAEYERMGELSASKVIRHIQAKREISLAKFIAGFDFEGVGELIMEKVVSSGFNTFDKLLSAGIEDLSVIYGLGEITAKTIFNGLKECEADMKKILSTGVILIAEPPDADAIPLSGLSFCFTGELKSLKRNQAEEKIKALGGSAKSTVVKGLSYLVTNDPGSGSAKNKKAQSMGVKIINEEEFLALISKNTIQSAAKSEANQKELF